jgi:hypothetical protein
MGSAFSRALRLALPTCREGFFIYGTTSQTFAGLSHVQMLRKCTGLYLCIIQVYEENHYNIINMPGWVHSAGAGQYAAGIAPTMDVAGRHQLRVEK